jgi:hypothetical protein
VSEFEWWCQYGWYQDGVEDFLVALALAGAYVVVSADVYVFHRTRDRRGRGVLVSLPILAWALLACRQAINTSQIDMAGNYSHYPHFWWCILGSSLAGLLVSASTLATDRLLAAPGPYGGVSRGVIRCNIVSLAVWLAVWSWAFAHEATL